MPMKKYENDLDLEKYHSLFSSRLDKILFDKRADEGKAIKDICDRCTFSKDHLSKIRKKQSRPSFSSMILIPVAIGIEPAELILPDDMVIVKKSDLASIPYDFRNTANQLISTLSPRQKELLKKLVLGIFHLQDRL